MAEVIGNVTSRATAESGVLQTFAIQRGITPTQMEEIVYLTHTDPLILAVEPEDEERFGTLENFNGWLAEKRRSLYVLLNPENHVAGLFWIGEKELPPGEYTENVNAHAYRYTTATRLYTSARGQGLSNPTLEAMIQDYASIHQLDQVGLWAEIAATNDASIAMTQKAGYRIVSQADAARRIIMVREWARGAI